MKNNYKVPISQYLWHKLKRCAIPAIHRALGGWYCDSCHAYHWGNVIAYELDYSDCYEEVTVCHKGLEHFNIDITQQPVKSYSPTLKSIMLTSKQAAGIFGKVGDPSA